MEEKLYKTYLFGELPYGATFVLDDKSCCKYLPSLLRDAKYHWHLEQEVNTRIYTDSLEKGSDYIFVADDRPVACEVSMDKRKDPPVSVRLASLNEIMWKETTPEEQQEMDLMTDLLKFDPGYGDVYFRLTVRLDECDIVLSDVRFAKPEDTRFVVVAQYEEGSGHIDFARTLERAEELLKGTKE